jgi:hypothetical protein
MADDGDVQIATGHLTELLALGTPHPPPYFLQVLHQLMRRGALEPCGRAGSAPKSAALFDLSRACKAKILATLSGAGFMPTQIGETARLLDRVHSLAPALTGIRAGAEWHLQLWLEPMAFSAEGWRERGREEPPPPPEDMGRLERYAIPVLMLNLTDEPIQHATPRAHSPAVMISLDLRELLTPILKAFEEMAA